MFIWLRILTPNFRPYFTLIQTPGIQIPWLTLIGTVCCYLDKWYNSCKGTYSSLLSIWLRMCKIRTQQIITIVLKTILKISRHAENHVKSFNLCWNIVFKMHYRFQPFWNLVFNMHYRFQNILKFSKCFFKMFSTHFKHKNSPMVWTMLKTVLRTMSNISKCFENHIENLKAWVVLQKKAWCDHDVTFWKHISQN